MKDLPFIILYSMLGEAGFVRWARAAGNICNWMDITAYVKMECTWGVNSDTGKVLFTAYIRGKTDLRFRKRLSFYENRAPYPLNRPTKTRTRTKTVFETVENHQCGHPKTRNSNRRIESSGFRVRHFSAE